MRIKLICLLGLINLTLAAAPVLETKPDAAFFEKFQPVKAPAVSGLDMKKGDRLAICGDSITEQRLYSRIMEDYLTMCAPQLQVTVRQYGWSGEKVPGFLARMTNDCLRFNPTIATTCYGMNDCEYRPYEDRIGHTYETNSVKMVEALKAHGVRVVLGSPGPVSKMPSWVKSAAGTTEDLNLNLCTLRNIDIAIAQNEKVRFADVFWPLLNASYTGGQEYGTNYAVPGNDGVHPLWAGHIMMAYAFLTALGLDGDIGTFTVDLKRDKIKVSAGHKVISAKAGEYTVESSRYPFCACAPEGEAATNYPVCGQDGVESEKSIRSGMTLVPFNEKLNRLMLVVKNATASRYQVTWGDDSKSFTAEQLAQGINLAVEFPANPFTAAFAKVDEAVAAKQAYETKEMKTLFRQAGTPPRRPTMKEITAHTDEIVGDTEKEHATLAAAVQSAFVPVTHVIKITAQ
jgi:lysophospholipase L1-like esterase